jgi:cell division protein FtsL
MKPFISLFAIVATLFSFVFIKMEVRRMGYAVLKETRQFKLLRDQNRSLAIELVQRTTPERVEHLAERQLTLNHAKIGQIIQLTGQRLAVPQ